MAITSQERERFRDQLRPIVEREAAALYHEYGRLIGRELPPWCEAGERAWSHWRQTAWWTVTRDIAGPAGGDGRGVFGVLIDFFGYR